MTSGADRIQQQLCSRWCWWCWCWWSLEAYGGTSG